MFNEQNTRNFKRMHACLTSWFVIENLQTYGVLCNFLARVWVPAVASRLGYIACYIYNYTWQFMFIRLYTYNMTCSMHACNGPFTRPRVDPVWVHPQAHFYSQARCLGVGCRHYMTIMNARKFDDRWQLFNGVMWDQVRRVWQKVQYKTSICIDTVDTVRPFYPIESDTLNVGHPQTTATL